MAKQLLMTLVLLSLFVGSQLDARVAQESSVTKANPAEHRSQVAKVREPRFAKPFHGFIGIWNTLGNLRRIFLNQKNETNNALQRIYEILADGFTDTATRKPQTTIKTTTSDSSANGTDSDSSTTTTERYRISRRELGYILGRNYRGLQKLFRIELNDALNQSQYNIQEYKQEKGNSLAQYTIPKEVPEPKSSKRSTT